MLCGAEIPLFAALLSNVTVLQSSTSYEGTHTREGLPSVYLHDSGHGMINITLPSVLTLETVEWTEKVAGQIVTYNTSLKDVAFRLSILEPSGIVIDFDWMGNMTILSPGLIPLNIVHYDIESRGEYLDFKINSTFQDSITLSLPFMWYFIDNRPTIYDQPITVELTPYMDYQLEINHTALTLFLQNNNSSPFDKISDVTQLKDISDINGVPEYCILVNDLYKRVETWGDLGNCTRCLVPSFNHTVETHAEFSVIQSGAWVVCDLIVQPIDSAPSGVEAGDMVSFNLNIHHGWGSNEEARDLVVRMQGEYIEVMNKSSNSSDVNGLLELSSLPLGSNHQVDGVAKLNDLLFVGSPVTILSRLRYAFNESLAGGDYSSSSICSKSIATKPVLVDLSRAYLNVPANWSVLQPATVYVEFALPKGTVYDLSCQLDFEFETDVNNEVEFKLNGYQIDSTNKDIKLGQSGRRRRATSTNTLTASVSPVTYPSTSTGSNIVSIKAVFSPSLAPVGTLVKTTATAFAAGQPTTLYSKSSVITSPELQMYKIMKGVSSDTVQVEIYVNHTMNSTADAYTIVLEDELSGLEIVDSSIEKSAGVVVSTRAEGRAVVATLDLISLSASTVHIKYKATANDNERGIHSMNNTAMLTYKTAGNVSTIYGIVTQKSCITRTFNESTSFLYQHGVTAAAVICGFIAGIVIVPLIIFLILYIMKRKCGGYGMLVTPESSTDYTTMSRQKTLLLDVGQKVTSDASTGLDESIVRILSNKDQMKAHREIDSLDIKSTVELDKRMENERVNSLMFMTISLLRGLLKNGDLNQKQFDDIVSQLKSSLKNLSDRLTTEYERALKEFSSSRSMYNRKRLGDLINEQRAKKKADLSKLSDGVDEADKKALVAAIDQQCQVEQDELSYRLKLDQDEKVEALRKEFALKKRIKSKKLQMETLQGLNEKNGLVEEKANWLLKEHAKNTALIDSMYDNELCRQKLVLEEKLAKRRALAELSQVQNQQQSELLNGLAANQMEIIKGAKKQKLITAEEAREMTSQIMSDLLNFKSEMEHEAEKQQNALHSKLSDLRRKLLDQKAKEAQSELQKFEQKCKQQETEKVIDPISLTEERLQLVARQEIEKISQEIQVDQENAVELKETRDKMIQTCKERLLQHEKKLLEGLKSDGLTDGQMQKILADHAANVDSLEAVQKQAYWQQDEALKLKLKARRKDWEKKMKLEQEDRAQLREQEAAVINQVINGQMSLSEEEREKIMQEHEKNMIRLENSLAISKLRQQKILEERLAERRARRLENLRQQQLLEEKKNEKKIAKYDDEDRSAAVAAMLKSQAEERVAVLADESQEMDLEEELEKVQLEMMEQRARDLRHQEDKLGSMIAQLQLSKARELAEIDEKQKAINELKRNLIDDMNDRGILSDMEAEQCIEQHRRQQEKLTRKLNQERDKQEKALKLKLAERLKAREKTLIDSYEDRLKSVLDNAPNKLAAKLRKAALMEKRTLAIEEFKIRMEKEISQSLEELKRQHSIKKAKLQQELELRFIASLIQQGKLQKSEVKACLRMLLPHKTDGDLEQLIAVLHTQNDKDDVDSGSEQDLLNASSASMLKERIAASVNLINNPSLPTIDEDSSRPASKAMGRIKSGKRKKKVNPIDPDYTPAVEFRGQPQLAPLKGTLRRPNMDGDF